MGNIQSLTRNGWQDSPTFTNMDVLGYDYDSGNKLLKVTDTGNKAHGFKDGTNTNNDFEYDSNGNLKIDRNKGITNIAYNHLNLPVQVTFASGNIQYFYSADGTKQKKVVSTGTETLYAGNYIYEGTTGNAQLQFFNHPEGYVMPKDVNNYSAGFDYVYQYRDHLNNIRLSYTDANGDGSVGTSEIVKESNYYPFGMIQKGYNGNVSSLGNSVAKRYMFGGKEYQEEFNINWYDITARNYDPALGRWMNLDPLAENGRRHSPYNYAFDNPVYFIDYDGMWPWPTGPIQVFFIKVVNKLINAEVEPIRVEGDSVDKVPGSGVEITGAPYSGDSGRSIAGHPEDNIQVPYEVISQAGSYAKGGSNGRRGDGKTDAKTSSKNTANKAKEIVKTGKEVKDGLAKGGEVPGAVETIYGSLSSTAEKETQNEPTVKYTAQGQLKSNTSYGKKVGENASPDYGGVAEYETRTDYDQAKKDSTRFSETNYFESIWIIKDTIE